MAPKGHLSCLFPSFKLSSAGEPNRVSGLGAASPDGGRVRCAGEAVAGQGEAQLPRGLWFRPLWRALLGLLPFAFCLVVRPQVDHFSFFLD